ncbi:MAG TPA: hypothetical protein VFC00_09570 [Micromonosporaceae bacterium]|nr:hypothetical protein [Micromonosporaceae bacterium]
MEFLRLLLRYIHLIGFAMLLGGFLVQYLSGRRQLNVVMQVGLGTMIGSGLLLAIPFPADVELNYVKLAVKLGIAFVIGAIFGVTRTRERAGKAVSQPLFLAIGVLALVNAAVAVFWR